MALTNSLVRRRGRPWWLLALAALAVSMAFLAAPALGIADDGRQPPAGVNVPQQSDYQPDTGRQPPAGADVAQTSDYVPAEQRAEPSTEAPTGTTTQVVNDEPNAVHHAPTVDRGDPNSSSPPE